MIGGLIIELIQELEYLRLFLRSLWLGLFPTPCAQHLRALPHIDIHIHRSDHKQVLAVPTGVVFVSIERHRVYDTDIDAAHGLSWRPGMFDVFDGTQTFGQYALALLPVAWVVQENRVDWPTLFRNCGYGLTLTRPSNDVAANGGSGIVDFHPDQTCVSRSAPRSSRRGFLLFQYEHLCE